MGSVTDLRRVGLGTEEPAAVVDQPKRPRESRCALAKMQYMRPAESPLRVWPRVPQRGSETFVRGNCGYVLELPAYEREWLFASCSDRGIARTRQRASRRGRPHWLFEAMKGHAFEMK